MKLALSLFLLLFISTILKCQAQDSSKHDYIINLNGNKVTGNIKYNVYKTNPKEIRFSSEAGSNEVLYHPVEISGFFSSTTQEYYISQTVDIDLSSNNIDQLRFSGNHDTTATETLFLKVVVSGKASLYFFTDSTSKPHFFIQIGSGPIKELNVYYHLQKQEDGERFLVQEAYKTQLLNDLGDCQGIEKKINSSDYSENNLADVFDYYNACHGNPSVYSQKKPFSKLFIHPGIILGYASNFIAPNTKNYTLVEPTRQFMIGVSLEFPIKKLKNLVSLYGDVHYKNYNTGFDAEDHSGLINMNFIDLTYMLKLRIPVSNNIRIYAEGGLSSDILNVDFGADQPDGPQVSYNTEVQFVSGLGICLMNHFSLEARYAFGHQNSTNILYNFNTHSSYLLMGFQL